MSKNLKRCFKQLELIAKIKNPKVRQQVLSDISKTDCYYHALHEIVSNTVKGNIPLTSYEKNKLKKYEKYIKPFVCKRRSASDISIQKQKQKAVKQSGGWLPLLITAAGAILSAILNRR